MALMPVRTMPEARPESQRPPVKGWNTRDSLDGMEEGYAVILDNFFPGTEKVTLRRGSASHKTGMSGSVESLLDYVGPTGSAKLFAVNDGKIYDATSAGAVGAASVSGLTNSRFQHTQITTAAGHYLTAMNGADTPRLFDGSTWGTTGFTGPTVANLIWCNTHQRRLWFGEVNSMTAYYLGVDAITGAAAAFPLGAIARRGGYIMAMGTWTRDGGDGVDDVAVFVTSEGEAILYQGTDPAAAATWQLVGVFRIGKPIGRRCIMKAGADLMIATQDGLVACSSILTMDRSQAQKVALTAQINSAVNAAVVAAGSTYGWQPILYPKGTQLLWNIPQTVSGRYYQFVFNTLTGAPCRFTGMNAVCWGVLGDNIYFGGTDGKVYLADSGATDGGSAIAGDILPAFSDFGSARKKAFKMAEPIWQGVGNPNAALDLNVDYQIAAPTGVPASSPVNSALWGISKWGVGVWGSDNQIYRGRRGVRGMGKAAALRMRVSSTHSRPSLMSTNIWYLPGSGM